MVNYNVSKTILLKAEQDFGLDVVDEVRTSVEKLGIERATSKFEDMELFTHIACLEYMYADDDY